MNGRADKLFLMGVGVGGHIAVLSAFYSQHVLGGAFCLDTALPDGLVQGVTGGEGSAIYPLFDAKKNMFVCVTRWKSSSNKAEDDKVKG